jgi:flagellar export protein FliJ
MNNKRKLDRAGKLLAISQADERGVQQAFDIALAAADDIRAKLVEAELAMINRHELARQRLIGGGPAEPDQAYPDAVSKLRRQTTRLLTRQKQADAELEKKRDDLLAAMTRRRAAQLVCERLEADQSAGDARGETKQLDEVHAAALARRGSWRQGSGVTDAGSRTS